jgi:hypothetical protein
MIRAIVARYPPGGDWNRSGVRPDASLARALYLKEAHSDKNRRAARSASQMAASIAHTTGRRMWSSG